MNRLVPGFILALALIFGLAACGKQQFAGASHPQPRQAPAAETVPPAAETLRFERPLEITALSEAPDSAEIFVRSGIFYFDKGAFAQAALEFETAQDMVKDPKGEFAKTCCKAAAVSHLLADDVKAFAQAMDRFRGLYTSHQLLDLPRSDPAAHNLLTLADSLKRRRNLQ